jgi:hypothetical protein
MVDPGEWLPLLGVGLLAMTTIVGIGGAWAHGRLRGMQDAARRRDEEMDTQGRLERMERTLATVAEEIERLGEVQRFALKVIAEKAGVRGAETEPPQQSQGRVITPH